MEHEELLYHRPLSKRILVARKEYTCVFCRKPIAIGQRYTRYAYIGEEGFECDKFHSMYGYCSEEE